MRLHCSILVHIVVFYRDGQKLDAQLGAKALANDETAEEEFKLSDVANIFGSRLFWIIAMLCVLYYSAIFPSSVMPPICYSAISVSTPLQLPIYSVGSPSERLSSLRPSAIFSIVRVKAQQC